MTTKFSDSKNLLPRPALMILAAVCLIAALFAPATCAEQKKPKKNVPLILKSANSNENTYVDGAFISYLKGNVTFLYDDITIRSDEATWWRNEGKVHFKDNIKITRQSQLLTCDQVNFTKDNNRIEASGHFFYRDTAQLTELTGDKATYLLENRVFDIVGKPKLMRFDTSAAETLTIIGKKLDYVDSLKLASAFDDVVITKGKLISRCDKAQYQTEKNLAFLRLKPLINYDINEITGDSIDMQFGKESLEHASVYGNSHVVYIDTGGKENDTAYTHVWGDSLFLSISDSGDLDSLWVHGKAVSKSFSAKEKNVVNQANGKTILIAFGDDGNVDKVKIWGNARSTYYMEEDDSRGVNESSGDSIMVAFNRGKAVFLNLTGSARGKFFPND